MRTGRLPDKSVDAAISQFGFLQEGNVPASARELARVVKDGAPYSVAAHRAVHTAGPSPAGNRSGRMAGMALPALPEESFRRVLCVVAHPEDMEYGTSATCTQHRSSSPKPCRTHSASLGDDAVRHIINSCPNTRDQDEKTVRYTLVSRIEVGKAS